MKKLISPAICLLIAFVFTGATSSRLPAPDNCGPTITFYNSSTATVTKVEVKVIASGIVHTYNSPSFPFVYSGSGGNLRVTYYFTSPRTGTLVWSDGTNCDTESYLADSDPYIEFSTGCSNYTVTNGWDICN